MQIAKIAAAVKKDPGLAEKLTVKRIRKEREALWKGIGTRIDVDGYELEFADFGKTLAVFAEVGVWRKALQDTWDASPCSGSDPWRVIVFADEYVPGNVLRLENHRKALAVHVGIETSASTTYNTKISGCQLPWHAA